MAEKRPRRPKPVGIVQTDPLPRSQLPPERLELRSVLFTIVDGPGKGLQFRVADDPIHVGTAPTNSIVLTDSTVSRQHAIIVQRPDGLLLKDPNSTNGTYVNGLRVREVFLKLGTQVRFGATTLSFEPVVAAELVLPHTGDAFLNVLGRSAPMRALFALLDRVASRQLTAILHGETGSGKELCARAIHQASPLRNGPFVVLDCSALDRDLGASELFGHEVGAFTGAVAPRAGAFEAAAGGTIFIDEVGELPLDLQAKMLRVLEQREVKRLGTNKAISIDCRVIAATHRDLQAMVKSGHFREDLYYRFAQVLIRIPPLRERREDIPLLAQRFLDHAHPVGAGPATFQPAALEALARMDFPGNVRELKNLVMRAAMMAAGDEILPEDLRRTELAQPTARPPADPDNDSLDGLKKQAVVAALKRNGYRRMKTARDLGISLPTLRRWMKRLGINPSITLEDE